MKPVVFLGPSLPLADARAIVDADFRPPAAMGDVYVAALELPPAIAIVDGYFENRPAVWHKEILFALADGIRVIGGSSMGALRAAELHAFGMEGIGRIFRDLADGVLEDDDEVAVVHTSAESGYRSVSVAMANLRYGLERAAELGAIQPATRFALEAAAKAAFYPDRSWRAVLDAGATLGIDPDELAALDRFVVTERPDQKRDDARAVLAAVRDGAAGSAPAKPSFVFEPTVFWDKLCTLRTPVYAPGSPAGDPILAGRIRDHVRFADDARERVRRLALLLVLVGEAARRGDIAMPDGRRALERFRRDRGLLSTDKLRSWLTEQRITSDDAVELARLEALVRTVEQRYADRIDTLLPAALRIENRYGAVVADVNAKWAALHERGIAVPTVGDTDLSLDELLAWYQARAGRVQTDIETHAAELGFAWPRPFTDELVATYLSATLPLP